MPRPKIPGLIWSPEDEVAFRKWRRFVLIGYGCFGLIVVAVWGVHRIVNDGHHDTAAIVNSPVQPPAVSIVPVTARR
jgi:hypothetical protein